MFIAVAPIYVAFFGFQDFRHGLPMGFQSESAPNARHVVDGSASLSPILGLRHIAWNWKKKSVIGKCGLVLPTLPRFIDIMLCKMS
jgi:hypothetical protein